MTELDEEALQIAAQAFANNYDFDNYDPLNPPSPDPLRKAIQAYLKYAKLQPPKSDALSEGHT